MKGKEGLKDAQTLFLQAAFPSTWFNSGFIYTSEIMQQLTFASKAMQACVQDVDYKIPLENCASFISVDKEMLL